MKSEEYTYVRGNSWCYDCLNYSRLFRVSYYHNPTSNSKFHTEGPSLCLYCLNKFYNRQKLGDY
jgi:hypothetical protein